MDMDETVETDYTQTVKEAVIRGAVGAVTSIVVTYGFAALIGKLKSRHVAKTETAATPAE